MKEFVYAVAGGALLAIVMSPETGFAADLPPEVQEQPVPLPEPSVLPFTGSLSIYGWLPWYDGKVGFNGLGPVDFDGTPGDLLDALNFTFMASGDIRWGSFGLFGDFIYLDIGGQRGTPGPFFGSAKVDMESFIVTTALTYQLYETETGWIQGVAGARFWSVDSKLTLTAGILPAVSRSKTISWVDPVVGLRARQALSESLFLTGTAIVGGFGAGSDLMWDLFGGIGYRFTPNFSGTAGFRAMGVDYSKGGDVLKLVNYGPQIALSLDF